MCCGDVFVSMCFTDDVEADIVSEPCTLLLYFSSSPVVNQTLLITLNWLKQPRAKVRTIYRIYSIIRMKDVLSGGERKRRKGNKFHNITKVLREGH